MVYILLLVPIHIYRPKIKLSSVTCNAHVSEHPKFFQEYCWEIAIFFLSLQQIIGGTLKRPLN